MTGRGRGGRDCTVVDGEGKWHPVACGRAEFRCLCELEAKTRPENQGDVEWLLREARTEAYVHMWHALTPLAMMVLSPVMPES